MSLPRTIRSFRRTTDGKSITLVEDTLPTSLEPNQVLIKVLAVSLNFRDVAMLHDRYPVKVIDRGVPCSDAAATVVAVGSSVDEFKEGDYVSPCFSIQDDNGNYAALGGDVDGVLREYAIYDQRFITKIPKHLSPEEASTITCAGVTAWTALTLDKKNTQVEYAVMEGTGGVSNFAVLICINAGIKAIITSSSDEKLNQIKALSEKNIFGINYRTTPDWDKEVLTLTNNRGVDVVVNNVGETSLEKNVNALKNRGGVVSVVGFLGGEFKQNERPNFMIPLMTKAASVQGIAVGTVQDQKDLCEFLEKHEVSLKPLIDKVFDFEHSADAFDYLYSGAHVGKVVIKL